VLQEFDTALFRLVHHWSGNAAVDSFVTIFNGGAWFKQIGILLAIVLFWKGGRRMRVCLLFLGLVIAIGDGVIVGGMKQAIARQRPYVQFTDIHPLGRGDAFSMPSGHAANITAAAIVLAAFYRRSRWFMFPIAFMVCFARVYSGVHFPSDVLIGATLALLYSSAILWGVEWLWRKKAPTVAPRWFAEVPSLLRVTNAPKKLESPHVDSYGDYDWKRLGWYLIGAVFLLRLLYLAGGKIELSEDEAYQWLWSKHLALSYYSKPPLIAYVQFLGTHIFGDKQFGIRFFSPLFASMTAAALLVFLSRYANSRVAFFTVAAACATPLLAVGATLMTIDALSVFFWMLGMVLIWRAIQNNSTSDWLIAGVVIAFGLLAKYVALLEWICVFIFLFAHAPARIQFRRPGLYLAIGVSLLGLVPVIIWNQQHNWITLTHLNERSGLNEAWRFRSGFILDFVLAEFGLLNPLFFILAVGACLKFWKSRTPLQTFLFCMGAPLFVGYFLYTIRARVQPNWIAPSILPLFALAALFWEARWNEIKHILRSTLKWAFGLGLIAVVFLHDTNLTQKVLSFTLPVKFDPLARVRGWSSLAATVQREKQALAASGKQPFVIGGHYGIASLLTFYTPEARRQAANNNLIYALASDRPVSQFYFWPSYLGRVGEDALFVEREGAPEPPELKAQFERVEDLGPRNIEYRGRVLHQIHLYACRNLRDQTASERRR
jgi:4-amino-4-deoxy-L-arabinose transferase-like glycosyltransferase/membrane-associated phospholipid phosphatase